MSLPGTTETIVMADNNGHSSVFIDKLDNVSQTPVVITDEDKWVHQMSIPQSSPDNNQKGPKFVSALKRKRVLEKFVYVTSVLTMGFLVYAILTAQWLLPYYYAISAPVLVLIRVVLYWKLKWQYFLLDFCYSANTLWYVYLWAVPGEGLFFSVVFSLANGPVLWAVVVFRNSLVFHSLDKVTSTFIHFLPSFLSFGVRWYTDTSSMYWYKPFIPDPVEPSFIWLVAVPQGCFMVHSLIYSLIVNVILKPSDKFLTSYRYITTREGTCLYGFFNWFGPRSRVYVYTIFNWVFCLLTVLLARLLYEYFIAHCVVLAFVVLVCIYNGASFYVDIFSVRGFQDED